MAWSSSSDVQKPKRKSTPSSNRIRGNFACFQCGRSYIRKDSLQRHLNYECGIEPQFQCPFCPQKCKRKAHQIRHITRQHKDKIGLLEENNPDLIKRSSSNSNAKVFEPQTTSSIGFDAIPATTGYDAADGGGSSGTDEKAADIHLSGNF